jgi:hypothetical protein
MGACQGIFCMPVLTAMVAQATGVSIDRVAPMTTRPPVRPLPLEALASLTEQSESLRGEKTARSEGDCTS